MSEMALINFQQPYRSFVQEDNGSKSKDQYVEEATTIEDYRKVANRLKTYSNWPNEELSKECLAKAGFIYTGYDDIVVCPFCKIEGYRWTTGDDPMTDHRNWNPHCLFFRNNIERDQATNITKSVDTCGLYGVEVLPKTSEEDDKTINLQRLGIQTGKPPKYPDYITYESRLATFEDWPKSLKQRPADLAEAGFYYSGLGDQTVCYHCGGGLKDWEEDDDPWEQHALWFSTCVLVNLKKGKDYIEHVKRKYEDMLSIPESNDIETREDSSDTESLSDKLEENTLDAERENEKTICKICYKNELGVVFLPCGHIVACADCAAILKKCAVCRKTVEATVRAYLSKARQDILKLSSFTRYLPSRRRAERRNQSKGLDAMALLDIQQHFQYRSFGDQTDNGSKSSDTLLQTSAPRTEYLSLESRLETFTNWPNVEVSKELLAKAGFIYTGQDDIVICPLCKIEGYRWVSGDDPMADHRHWNPQCPFMRGNIEHDHAESNTRTVDTCGLFGVEVLPNSLPEDDKTINFQRLGIQAGKGPQNQDKITYDSRLATFQEWPRSIKQRPANLAEAGFYYTGAGDQTLCFYCGGGLKDWEENDDPWEQHALWFSKCVYVNLKKGKDYIDEVKRKYEPKLSIPGPSGLQTKEEPTNTESPESKCDENKVKKSERENEAIEKTLCKICYKNELGVVFLPCGHIVACVDCAAALKNCAVCRKPLEATVRAFLS
ncbi:death-associated inhibitor of apoptosis 1-like [Diorhabda carinulata]|uniref:death-associated inhibitor of apoptosis 1-like n=1 Tax=Diorhabda carinulata TaxID=1163345 RepID=UPI0025A0EDB6|nr:death-associated inhibitor of apoptosis 1-like [Diorhabda carinulata]